MPEPPRGGALDGLEGVWASLVSLGRSLDDEEFELATECPGWSVRDQFSHVIGTELLLAGEGAPSPAAPSGPHVRNGLGELNERFVAARRGRSGAAVVDELAALAVARLAELRRLDDEAADAVAASPIGIVPYVDYVSARTLDAFVHEQDVRRATGRSGGRGGLAERAALDRLEAAMPYVLARRVAAPVGTTVRLDVLGEHGRVVQLAVVGGEDGKPRCVATPVIDGPPSAALRLDEETFARRACGRITAIAARGAPCTEAAGDAQLVGAFLAAMVVVA